MLDEPRTPNDVLNNFYKVLNVIEVKRKAALNEEIEEE